MTAMHRLRRGDDWNAAHGGLRGSTVLTTGTLLAMIATLVNLATDLLFPESGVSRTVPVLASWLGWILAMTLTGAGFLLIGIGPAMSRLGIIVGAYHVVYALMLLVVIFSELALPLPIVAISLGRCILLVAYALRERHALGRGTTVLLGSAATAQAVKIGLRVAGILPDPGAPLVPVLEAVTGVALALAVLQTSHVVRGYEARWATTVVGQRAPGFEAFDNPDHELPGTTGPAKPRRRGSGS